jgi:hypothetical protein
MRTLSAIERLDNELCVAITMIKFNKTVNLNLIFEPTNCFIAMNCYKPEMFKRNQLNLLFLLHYKQIH